MPPAVPQILLDIAFDSPRLATGPTDRIDKEPEMTFGTPKRTDTQLRTIPIANRPKTGLGFLPC